MRSVGLITSLGALVIALAVFIYQMNNAPSWSDNSENAPEQRKIYSSANAMGGHSETETRQPDSLRGTRHGVRLFSDQDGLIVTHRLKDMFDYYMSASGEITEQDIRQLIYNALSVQLSGEALKQATDICDKYFHYKQALNTFDEQYLSEEHSLRTERTAEFFRKRHQDLTALQNDIMGIEIADAFFRQDRIADEVILERAGILQSEMTEENKRQALINLAERLPHESVNQQHQKHVMKMLAETRSSESNAEERFENRAQLVGEDAAERLARLDTERQQWENRLSVFRDELKKTEESGLSEADKESSVQQLLDKHFEENEQLRVRAVSGLL